MKDYYYFLGVSRDASADEIRRAYRKLSLKYHPDKNDNDPYFSQRFQEVLEAYETLEDTDRRRAYDRAYDDGAANLRNNLPPHIKTFSSNKIRAKKGDEIILNWQTTNADMVKILPFGLEKAYGERTFRITEFKDGQFHVVLQATNTRINKSVVQGITITEVFENATTESVASTFQSAASPVAPGAGRPRVPKIIIFITILTAMVLMLMFFLR